MLEENDVLNATQCFEQATKNKKNFCDWYFALLTLADELKSKTTKHTDESENTEEMTLWLGTLK